MNSPKAGTFLVARPQLLDPNFDATVVLLCAVDEDGAMGLVLNRTVQDLSPHILLPECSWAEETGEHIFWGGPVQEPRLHALHGAAPTGPDALEVAPGISFGGDLEALQPVHKSGKPIHFFLGYSGWDADQLAQELEEDIWLCCAADSHTVFQTPPDKLWRTLLAKIDPQLNWLGVEPGRN